jgi:hypothetical protein
MTSGDQYEHWEPHDGQAALRNQITQTRADLGDTITELAARTDVRARARQAVADARARAGDAMREKARSATMRTQGAARSGASSARHLLAWVAKSPASVAMAGGVGALAGLGIYALLRRRRPSGFAGARALRAARRRTRSRRAMHSGGRRLVHSASQGWRR